MWLELLEPPQLFCHLPGAGRPAYLDTGRAGSPERPRHRVQRQTVHPIRDQPDAARPGAERAQMEEAVSL